MKTKKIAVLCLAVFMLVTAVPSASAAQSGIAPFWTNTSTVTVSILLSGTSATCEAEVVGFPGTTSITGNMYLYKKNQNGTFTLLKSWLNQSVSGNVLEMSESYTVTGGVTYKLSVSAVVTRNGTSESVSNSVERSVP
jgi:hypothetical protein